jgi:hypothetical protein
MRCFVVKVRQLLSKGNAKLGESIFGWTLQAIHTCPGRTETCSRWCFASHGRFCTTQMEARNRWRLSQAKKAGFVDAMSSEIYRRGVLIVRVHIGGDFFSPRYVQKWIEIAARHPAVRFFAYSRSWRTEAIRPLLYAWGSLPNVRLWLSADRDSGIPRDVPEGIRVAWLQVDEAPPQGGNLVFQVRRLRRMALPMFVPVCEQETPAGKAAGANCSSCRVCWV